MMMVMMVVMVPPPDHDVMVVMMVVMTELNRNLGDLVGRLLGLPGGFRLQQRHRVRDRIKEIPVTCRRSELWRLRRRRLSRRHCGQCSGCSQ